MRVESMSHDLTGFEGESLGLLLFEGDLDGISCLGDLAPEVRSRVELERFTGKKESLIKATFPDGRIKRVILAGLGKREKATPDAFRTSAALVVKEAAKSGAASLALATPTAPDALISQALTEGALLGSYSFDRYRSKKDESETKIEQILVAGGDEGALNRGALFACGQNYARDLANEPANVINPLTFSGEAQKVAKEVGLECTVYDESHLQGMGMNAILAVGKGSAIPPKFVHLVYRPAERSAKRVAFVGKGITFDSGGLNIKPDEHMRGMKGDKMGACNVLAAMRTIARLRPPVEVHGLIGLAENMPSGDAYRPDDVIKAYNGKTIEIGSTDAEGRVTMADVLSYASKLKPDYIIDMATLTGACIIALGGYMAGLFSNDENFAGGLLSASSRSGERIWRLPLDDERLRKHIDSPIADVANVGGRPGGAITAAMFLQEFVEEGIPWAHLDVAGVDNYKEPFGYYAKGATGFGVRLFLEWLYSII